MGVSGDPRKRPGAKVIDTGVVVGSDIQVEAPPRGVTDPGPGEHLWLVVAAYRVVPRGADARYDLDMENLLTIQGPGCFKCEAPWSPDLAARACTGSLDELMPG